MMFLLLMTLGYFKVLPWYAVIGLMCVEVSFEILLNILTSLIKYKGN